MISALIAVVIGLIVAVTPVADVFLVFQDEPAPDLARHFVLAEGVRAIEKGGDVVITRTGLPIEHKKYLPPRMIGDVIFSTPLTAKSALVVDFASNEILFSKNIDEQRSIASVTKLMSALVAMNNISSWDKQVIIQDSDLKTGRQYLYSGDKINIRELFRAALISSSNTATMALARATGLSEQEFVARMNQKAKAMGLMQTVFVEPTGLDHDNVSTARELIVLLKFALDQKPIKHAVSQSAYSIKVSGTKRKIYATNWLLTGQVKRFSDAKVIGGKTGFNEAAQYNFVAQYKYENNLVSSIVLGADDHYDRFTESDMLVNWVFENYNWADDPEY